MIDNATKERLSTLKLNEILYIFSVLFDYVLNTQPVIINSQLNTTLLQPSENNVLSLLTIILQMEGNLQLDRAKKFSDFKDAIELENQLRAETRYPVISLVDMIELFKLILIYGKILDLDMVSVQIAARIFEKSIPDFSEDNVDVFIRRTAQVYLEFLGQLIQLQEIGAAECFQLAVQFFVAVMDPKAFKPQLQLTSESNFGNAFGRSFLLSERAGSGISKGLDHRAITKYYQVLSALGCVKPLLKPFDINMFLDGRYSQSQFTAVQTRSRQLWVEEAGLVHSDEEPPIPDSPGRISRMISTVLASPRRRDGKTSPTSPPGASTAETSPPSSSSPRRPSLLGRRSGGRKLSSGASSSVVTPSSPGRAPSPSSPDRGSSPSTPLAHVGMSSRSLLSLVVQADQLLDESLIFQQVGGATARSRLKINRKPPPPKPPMGPPIILIQGASTDSMTSVVEAIEARAVEGFEKDHPNDAENVTAVDRAASELEKLKM